MRDLEVGTRGEFDLQPDPRLLQMLGEIDLDPWRCVAELVDNSIDGFLNAKRDGYPVDAPAVEVSLPAKPMPDSRISVRDNGPGMDSETLERAVRAGYSGNAPLDSLGLFGMGFNIATARLGATTTVWSTRAGDSLAHGVRIDFADLRSRRSFRTPHLVQSKADPGAHYTHIEITNLRLEQRDQIATPSEQRLVRAMLARSYASMLRPGGDPIHFTLGINDVRLEGKRHCVWGEERTAMVPGVGIVSAYKPFDQRLPIDSVVCGNCLASMLEVDLDDGRCLGCGRDEALHRRERRIRGWLGLQRYLSTSDYGIDFIRNGRKIEIANKDLFLWRQDGTDETEYPIDDPRGRGRFVGEVHVDHCPVDYSKTRFTREHRSWREVVSFLRGEGPLRPNIAEQRGFGPNDSLLATHFKAFRRNSPSSSQAGGWARWLVVPSNERATEMARQFDRGVPEFQSDERWWELILEEDEKKLYGDAPAPKADSEPASLPTGVPELLGDEPATRDAEAAPPERERVPSLSRTYELPRPLAITFEVEAFKAERGDPLLLGAPWRLLREAARKKAWTFLFDPAHEVFASLTMAPPDALLTELAWASLDVVRGTARETTPSDLLARLRRAYASADSLDPALIAQLAGRCLDDLASAVLAAVDPSDRSGLVEDLPEDERARVRSALVMRRAPTAAADNGTFLRFMPELLIPLVDTRIDLFLDGAVFDVIYEGIDLKDPDASVHARRGERDRLRSLISDVVRATSFDRVEPTPRREEMMRAIAAMRLLVPDRAME